MMKILDSKITKKYANKIALVRLGINSNPKDGDSHLRFYSSLPTLRLLLKNKVRVVLMDHRGQPDKPDAKLSMIGFARLFEKELKTKVVFLKNIEVAKKEIEKSPAQVFILENLRFWKEERGNDSDFASQLASLGDFFVNEAFSGSHRDHASFVQLPKFLPAYAGLNLAAEVKNLSGAMKAPKKPVVLVIGGAKISDKLGVVKNFWQKADSVLLGGGPANTALKLNGFPIGQSISEKEAEADFKSLVFSPKIYVPQDVEIAGDRILDIGPKTIKEYSSLIAKAGTIIWNGPMGLFEKKKFSKGTAAIWKAILKNKKAKIIIGGGETVVSLSALNIKLGKSKNVFLSTGGGAMLQFLGGKKLPGLEALNR